MTRPLRPAAWALLLLLGACHPGDDPPPAPPAPPLQVSSSKVSGLEASLPRVAPSLGGARLELTYLLEWYAAPTSEVAADGSIEVYNVWMLQGLEPVTVRFWGAGGEVLGAVGDRVLLPEPFRDGDTPRHEVRLLVDAPPGARTVSVALGNSGLESERERLP